MHVGVCYVCVCAHVALVYLCVYLCAYICMCAHISMCVYLCVRTYLCAYICVCVHIYVRISACAYIYVYTCVRACVTAARIQPMLYVFIKYKIVTHVHVYYPCFISSKIIKLPHAQTHMAQHYLKPCAVWNRGCFKTDTAQQSLQARMKIQKYRVC